MLLKLGIAATISKCSGRPPVGAAFQTRLPFTVAAPFPYAADRRGFPCKVIISNPRASGAQMFPPGFFRLVPGRES